MISLPTHRLLLADEPLAKLMPKEPFSATRDGQVRNPGWHMRQLIP